MSNKNKPEPSFSLHEFRSWLSKQQEPKTRQRKSKNQVAEAMIGRLVESRLGLKRLELKIAENNKTEIADILADDFKANGGKIIEVNELLVKIDVSSGSFQLPRIYTKDLEPQ